MACDLEDKPYFKDLMHKIEGMSRTTVNNIRKDDDLKKLFELCEKKGIEAKIPEDWNLKPSTRKFPGLFFKKS